MTEQAFELKSLESYSDTEITVLNIHLLRGKWSTAEEETVIEDTNFAPMLTNWACGYSFFGLISPRIPMLFVLELLEVIDHFMNLYIQEGGCKQVWEMVL